MSMFQGFIGPFLDCRRFVSVVGEATRRKRLRAAPIGSGRIICAASKALERYSAQTPRIEDAQRAGTADAHAPG